MKRTVEVDRIIGSDEREGVRGMLYAAATGGTTRRGTLSVRQLDRICAFTGCPWDTVNREARQEGLA